MVEALRNGTIDIIVSSHDPQDVDTKRLPFADAADGAIGLETLLGAALRLYHNDEVPLVRLIEALSTGPARLFGLPGGRLSPGAPADLALVDLDEPWIVSEAGIRSRSKNTCFEGARLQGKVLQTMVAGRTVFSAQAGNRSAKPGGAMLYTQLLAALAFGYLLGSVPFGLLITRAAGLGDVRNIGSGNIGATNVLRTGNKGLAALTLLLDALKGTAAVLIAGIYDRSLRSPPGSARSWDISSRSGWASREARAWRPISAYWPASPGRWRWSSPRSGSRRRYHALFVARGADRVRGRPAHAVLSWPRRLRRAVRRHDGDRLH